jgi:hypothetical protein
MLRRQFLKLVGAAPAAAALPAAAAAINADHLSAIDARLGSFTAGSPELGSRLVIGDDGMKVYDANGVLRVSMGRR